MVGIATVTCLILSIILIQQSFKENLSPSFSSSSSSSQGEQQIEGDINEHFGYLIYNNAAKMLGIHSPLRQQNLSFDPVLYPFESYEIINPYTFMIETPSEIEQIASLTNESQIRVIVCELNIHFPLGSQPEWMIMFAGENGIFHCLTNGYGREGHDYEIWTYGFSQHKILTNEGVFKYEPENNLEIEVVINQDELTSIKLGDIAGMIIPETYLKEDKSTVFNIINSFSYPQVEATLCVHEIYDKNLVVNNEEGYNLKKVLLDYTTQFTKDGKPSSLSELYEGMTIKVNYRQYYEGFNPSEFTFSQIEMMVPTQFNTMKVLVESIDNTISVIPEDQSLTLNTLVISENTKFYQNDVEISLDMIKSGATLEIEIPSCCDEFNPQKVHVQNVIVHME